MRRGDFRVGAWRECEWSTGKEIPITKTRKDEKTKGELTLGGELSGGSCTAAEHSANPRRASRTLAK
jgi:hypothetical protein